MKLDLSTKDFARVIGASESSVKRWADDGRIHVTRTEGGHRRIPLREAIQYIHAKRLTVVDPTPLGIPGIEVACQTRAETEGRRDQMVQSIVSGNVQFVRGIVANMYLEGHSVAEICDGPITSAMHDVGELWRHDADGVFIEHRATDTCVQALSHLRSLIPPPRHQAPTAVGCAVEDDPYLLPTWMVASTLAAGGWDAVNLGPDLPFSALLQAIRHYGPHLVWISVSTPMDKKRLITQCERMLAEDALRDVAVVIGGRASEPLRGLGASLHFGSSMGELAAFAQGLLAKRTKQA